MALLPALLLLVAAVEGETSPAQKPQGRSGLALQGDVIIPLKGYGDPSNLGYGGALGIWAEWARAVLQPQLAFHYGPGRDGAHFLDTSVSLGVLVLPLEGPITPFIGGGFGVRYLSVQGVTRTTDVGSLIRTRIEQTPGVEGFGPTLHGRIGALFFRDSPVELILTGEYGATFIEGTPQHLLFSIGLAT